MKIFGVVWAISWQLLITQDYIKCIWLTFGKIFFTDFSLYTNKQLLERIFEYFTDFRKFWLVRLATALCYKVFHIVMTVEHTPWQTSGYLLYYCYHVHCIVQKLSIICLLYQITGCGQYLNYVQTTPTVWFARLGKPD